MRLSDLTYTKPADLKYTDIAIWVDENAYKDDCDEEILYQYLYYLSNMIAHEGKYFDSVELYDLFSLYTASKLFMRLKNPKQFCETNPLPKIKSILNYIKTVSYGCKVDFEQEHYSASDENAPTVYVDTYNLGQYIAEESNIFDEIDFRTSILDLPSIFKQYLSKIPIKKNSAEWQNIYISCLLTILKSISFPKQDIDKINTKQEDLDIKLEMLYRKYYEEDPVLYHLDPSYKNYIVVLVRELRSIIARELSYETHSMITSDVSIKNLMIANNEDID